MRVQVTNIEFHWLNSQTVVSVESSKVLDIANGCHLAECPSLSVVIDRPKQDFGTELLADFLPFLALICDNLLTALNQPQNVLDFKHNLISLIESFER